MAPRRQRAEAALRTLRQQNEAMIELIEELKPAGRGRSEARDPRSPPPAAKGPTWDCGCGCKGNWAHRALDGLGCRACGRAAPRRAQRAAKAWHEGLTSQGRKEPPPLGANNPTPIPLAGLVQAGALGAPTSMSPRRRPLTPARLRARTI